MNCNWMVRHTQIKANMLKAIGIDASQMTMMEVDRLFKKNGLKFPKHKTNRH